ncbi:MAG TPA: cyanophycinase [Azospirillaceae bacterium]|nr:cyanophycinase [Azospirillaceae bacterium]
MSSVQVLAIVGGRLESDNAAIFAELKRLSNGRMAILATASGEPDDVGKETVEIFAAHGILSALLPLHGPEAAANAQDPALVAEIERWGSVWFTGGDQSLISAALEPDGIESPVLACIRRLHAEGGLVAGSSAGAACQSGPMIVGGASVQALAHGVTEDPATPGMMMGRGLNFFRHGLIDQHFIRRGRLGRLLVGMQTSGSRWGFGVDENTAMIVEGDSLRVVGEYGALIIDLGAAKVTGDRRRWDGVRVSYLDNGDGFDLKAMKPLPNPAKKRMRCSKRSWTAPAHSRRNIFGPYTFYELLVRLAEGDPAHYTEDTALAFEPISNTAVKLHLQRDKRRSKALCARTPAGIRYTALDFRLDIRCEQLSRAEWVRWRTAEQRSLVGPGDIPAGKIIVTGSSPLSGRPELMDGIIERIQGPVGVIAAASGDPKDAAADYVRLLRRHGLEAEDLGITPGTMPTLMDDPAMVERIAAKKTILFTGGDQKRLVDTLLHRGAETPLLTAILHVYLSGGTLVAVSGAAAALSGIMIAGGGSYQALRYGVAADAGHEGILIEEGFGLFDIGVLDQNVIDRNRLGRLIVACAEENSRFGFGLCEDSGLVVHGGGTEIEAIGRTGVVLVEMAPDQIQVQGDVFAAKGVQLALLKPGVRTDALRAGAPAVADDATRRVEDLVRMLEREVEQATRRGNGHDGRILVAMRRGQLGRVEVDLESERLGGD